MDNLTFYAKEIIVRNDVARAKELIRDIEDMINENPTPLGFMTLRNLSNKLKRFCAKKLPVILDGTAEKQNPPVNMTLNRFGGNGSKKIFENTHKTTIEKIEGEDVEFWYCTHIDVGYIDCENTVLITEATNSKFVIKSRYIRLLSCYCLDLDVRNDAEIFIQDSWNIKIRATENSDLLSEIYVHDFSNPVKSSCYKIIR